MTRGRNAPEPLLVRDASRRAPRGVHLLRQRVPRRAPVLDREDEHARVARQVRVELERDLELIRRERIRRRARHGRLLDVDVIADRRRLRRALHRGRRRRRLRRRHRLLRAAGEGGGRRARRSGGGCSKTARGRGGMERRYSFIRARRKEYIRAARATPDPGGEGRRARGRTAAGSRRTSGR